MAAMNLWELAGDGFLVIIILMLPSILRGSAVRRMVCAGAITLCASAALLLFALGFERPDFMDLAIALALLSVGSTLAYAHAVERWL